MRKILVILVSITVFAPVSFAANGFKEGNKLYLDGKYQDALAQYRQFIQKNPEYYEGYFNAGNALYRQEQYDGALGMYEKARELNPKDPDIQHNIEVTRKKMEEKKAQNQEPKSQDKNKENQQDQQQGKNGKKDGKQSKEDQEQQAQQQQAQQGKQGEKGDQKSEISDSESNKQPPSGMTEDEVQALLNQKQNQEKRLQGYFGKQYQKQNQEPDMFNMSPQEMMMYMQRKMMDPNYEPPQKGGSGGNEKDW